MICNYLKDGSTLIVRPGKTVDVLCPENGFYVQRQLIRMEYSPAIWFILLNQIS